MEGPETDGAGKAQARGGIRDRQIVLEPENQGMKSQTDGHAIWTLFWRLSALAFLGAAGFHLPQVLWPGDLAKEQAYHMIFVVIDTLLAFLVLRRPSWLPYLFTLFAIQQIWSHGARALELWAVGVFDQQSALVLLMMPVWLIALFVDPQRRSARLANVKLPTDSAANT